MKVGVIGAGYVGAVTAANFAKRSNEVVCVDILPEKVEQWQRGDSPIYEPGLSEMVQEGLESDNLRFTTNIREAVIDADVVFLAVPTPQNEKDNSADLSYVLKAAQDVGRCATDYLVVVDKSTVPVGTAVWVREAISKVTDINIDVVSNPEFLREGQAMADFAKPNQIVIGTDSDKAAAVMRELYGPFFRRRPEVFNVMDPASAETVKYAINSFLSVKLSFANQLAQFCEKYGADYDRVRPAVGKDYRIGDEFLFTGPGWGGSCFPKDTRAFVKMGTDMDLDLSVVAAAIEANEEQKLVIPNKVLDFFDSSVAGKNIALWGLAFKNNTDDVRESPALTIVDELEAKGANIVAYDPKAMESFKKTRPQSKITYVHDEYQALEGADALVIATNWEQFYSPNFKRVKEQVDVIIDGRNVYDPEAMERRGFYYNSLGRKTVDGRAA